MSLIQGNSARNLLPPIPTGPSSDYRGTKSSTLSFNLGEYGSTNLVRPSISPTQQSEEVNTKYEIDASELKFMEEIGRGILILAHWTIV